MMRRQLVFSLLVPVAWALFPWQINAEEPRGGMSVDVNGYGTLGLVHSDDSSADYITDFYRPNGVGHTHAWGANIDSRVGVQATAYLSPQLTAVLQLVSEQRYDNSYTPRVEWANIAYQVTEDFRLRVGRIRLSPFLFADTRKVGYAYPWVRPPTELYNLVPISSNDGGDLTYQLQLGEMTNTLELSYGGLKEKAPETAGGGTTDTQELLGIVNRLEYGPMTVQFSYYQASATTEAAASLFDAFRQFGPEGIAIAERFKLDESSVKFSSFGVHYAPGSWFAVAEWANTRSQSLIGHRTAWYLSGGYRFGDLTPFASFSRVNVTSKSSHPGLTLAAVPAELRDTAAALNTVLNGILSSGQAQKTAALGLRWDFMSSVALKLQYEHIVRDDQSPGTFINMQPDFQVGGSVNLLSASIDFVF